MPPRILILTATYNGQRWLGEQLETFRRQEGVEASVVVSDDQSSDNTVSILGSWCKKIDLRLLPTQQVRFGNANRNFVRLIRDAPLEDFEYFAFSDQDDIWVDNKLSRAISLLEINRLDAYSSDVVAFWSNGREKIVIKSQPQQDLDHLFESAGPGCTFVLSRRAFLQLRDWVRENYNAVSTAKVHDWLIYAFGRERGWAWAIDGYAGLRYRQHENNEVGANVGLKSASRRISYLANGSYRLDALRIAELTGHRSASLERLRRFSFGDRFVLAVCSRKFRRKTSDAFVLALAFLIMRRRQRERPLPAVLST